MDLSKPKSYLVDVVEVDKSKRIRCQANGCGHAVYARIHVVLDAGNFVVLGGDCFQRIYGGVLKGEKSSYGGSASSPTQLTEEMRTLLVSNTIAFVNLLEERRRQFEAETAKRRALLAHQDAQRKLEIGKPNEPLVQSFIQKHTDIEALLQMDNSWKDSLPGMPSSAERNFSGEFRYVWSSSWWTSAEKLRMAIVETLGRGEYSNILYEAIVLVRRQPSICPKEFAITLEKDGVPKEITLQCLNTVRLAVRAKPSPSVHSKWR